MNSSKIIEESKFKTDIELQKEKNKIEKDQENLHLNEIMQETKEFVLLVEKLKNELGTSILSNLNLQ